MLLLCLFSKKITFSFQVIVQIRVTAGAVCSLSSVKNSFKPKLPDPVWLTMCPPGENDTFSDTFAVTVAIKNLPFTP